MSWLKNLGWIGTAAAAVFASIWGFLTYEDQARLAFRKPMVDHTINLCLEITDLAGNMVGEPDEGQWRKHIGDFWRLYYGKLVMIENQELATSMVELGQSVKAAEFTSRSSLGAGALAVSRACRQQISVLMDTGWKMDPVGLITTSDVLKGTVTK